MEASILRNRRKKKPKTNRIEIIDKADMKKIEDQWNTKLALWKISEVDNILDKLTKE